MPTSSTSVRPLRLRRNPRTCPCTSPAMARRTRPPGPAGAPPWSRVVGAAVHATTAQSRTSRVNTGKISVSTADGLRRVLRRVRLECSSVGLLICTLWSADDLQSQLSPAWPLSSPKMSHENPPALDARLVRAHPGADDAVPERRPGVAGRQCRLAAHRGYRRPDPGPTRGSRDRHPVGHDAAAGT